MTVLLLYYYYVIFKMYDNENLAEDFDLAFVFKYHMLNPRGLK